MKKIIFIPILVVILYLSTALYSVHQVHKGIYYNDKLLINEYVEWNQLRENFKNYLNIQLLKETQNNEDFKNLGGLGVLITGFASKIADNMLDTYVNSEGFSMLLENNKKIKDLPEPSFNTLLGGIKIMDFTGHSSFRIKHKFEKQEISLLFERKDIDWKITQIEFPDDLFEDFKNSNLDKIQNIFKDKKKPKKSITSKHIEKIQKHKKNITSKDLEKIQKHIRKCWKTSYGFNELKDNVILKISLSKDMSVFSARVVDVNKYVSNSLYKAVADSARRAVIDCSPLPLDNSYYESLKEFEMEFNPNF